jgi:hypothetical protein
MRSLQRKDGNDDGRKQFGSFLTQLESVALMAPH